MKKISLLLGVLFFSFMIGCKSIDESIQPDTSKSKQGKTMRLQGVPEGNGQTTFAMGGISGECQQYIFNDPNQNGLAGRQGLLAVRAITWTEGFMQNKFNINDKPAFLSEPYRSYELMLATAVASKEGWEDGGDLAIENRLYIGLSPMTRLAGYPCNEYYGEQEVFAYYSKVVNRGWNLWYNNQQMSFEQLADLVELELQKDEFVTFLSSETTINRGNIGEFDNGFWWVDMTAEEFKGRCSQAGVLSDLIAYYGPQGQIGNAYAQFNIQTGNIFEDVVIRSLGRTKNRKRFPVSDPSLRPQSVEPDAIEQSAATIQERRGGKTVNKAIWWREGTLIDAKFKNSGDVEYERQGDYPDQTAGYIDVLGRIDEARFSYDPLQSFTDLGSPIIKKASQSGAAILHYVTPSDIGISEEIKNKASEKNILILQSKMQRTIFGDQVRVGFANRINQDRVNGYGFGGLSYYGDGVYIDFSKRR
ncbi:hypothetical protein VB796_16870 [Arcicella sp. LKC2W]|uniref:hypothetical protein n=1 Tax=Arcicella sp. LKC2W TaxID=2984198 RepID=UPI002B1F0D33|nr:hypothetical protein [Arcicella sp. LKC2W]MEA5460733.1 hypothetical protein [Arcicella sp. LKC2W]